MIRATSRLRAKRAARAIGPRAGGCDFPVDPSLDGASAQVWWRAEVDADLLLLVASPLSEPSWLTAGDLPDRRLIQGQGRRAIRLSLLAESSEAATPLAAAIPLDDHLPRRLAALSRLWRQRRGQPAEEDVITVQRRQRLKAMLRAWDARQGGAPYRAIASGLYGSERVAAAPWKTSSLRDATLRLVRDAEGMVGGGYHALLA
ncbi:DUF2285 domain-containing protein [Caulobacter hibisci]|uniref:DUF2285 domain-containing protein n=1 Tax=Caulobacter hibisci TaxID=2035993 RepID=UPI002FCDD810